MILICIRETYRVNSDSLPNLWLNIAIKASGTSFPGDYSDLEPPDTISNSEVKHFRANDSVRLPHAKVGHRQGFIPYSGFLGRFFYFHMFFSIN